MKTIDIGGQPRPVKYGINALSEFNEATRTTLQWIFEIAQNPLLMNFNQIRWMVYVGLKNGCKEQQREIDFTVEQVGTWLDKEFLKFPEFAKAMREDLPMLEDDEKNLNGPVKEPGH